MLLTADPLTLPDVVALLAALDAGEDDALVLAALADALEEAGEEALAAGLRRINSASGRARRQPCEINYDRRRSWVCMPEEGYLLDDPFFVERTVFLRMSGGQFHRETDARMASRRYPTRSAAFLALALALS